MRKPKKNKKKSSPRKPSKWDEKMQDLAHRVTKSKFNEKTASLSLEVIDGHPDAMKKLEAAHILKKIDAPSLKTEARKIQKKIKKHYPGVSQQIQIFLSPSAFKLQA